MMWQGYGNVDAGVFDSPLDDQIGGIVEDNKGHVVVKGLDDRSSGSSETAMPIYGYTAGRENNDNGGMVFAKGRCG